MTIVHPKYKLRSWIELDKLDFAELSYEPRAINILLENPNKIYWPGFSSNPASIEFLSKNQDKINWTGMC